MLCTILCTVQNIKDQYQCCCCWCALRPLWQTGLSLLPVPLSRRSLIAVDFFFFFSLPTRQPTRQSSTIIIRWKEMRTWWWTRQGNGQTGGWVSTIISTIRPSAFRPAPTIATTSFRLRVDQSVTDRMLPVGEEEKDRVLDLSFFALSSDCNDERSRWMEKQQAKEEMDASWLLLLCSPRPSFPFRRPPNYKMKCGRLRL